MKYKYYSYTYALSLIFSNKKNYIESSDTNKPLNQYILGCDESYATDYWVGFVQIINQVMYFVILKSEL